MLLIYGITIFTGAALLFVVQPMVGRMVLPLLGGSPAVWNTAMVFYQAGAAGRICLRAFHDAVAGRATPSDAARRAAHSSRFSRCP